MKTTTIPKMASTKQYRAIFGMAKAAGVGEDDLRDMLAAHFERESFKDLTDFQAKRLIDILTKLYPSLKKKRKRRRYPDAMFRFITPRQIKMILSFARSMDWDETNINTLTVRMFPKIKELHERIGAPVTFRRLSVEQAQGLIEAIKSIQARAHEKKRKRIRSGFLF